MNNFKINDLDIYSNEIFDLQSKLMDKDLMITKLELELFVEKQKVDFLKHLAKI